jgi:hypothetical protein
MANLYLIIWLKLLEENRLIKKEKLFKNRMRIERNEREMRRVYRKILNYLKDSDKNLEERIKLMIDLIKILEKERIII